MGNELEATASIEIAKHTLLSGGLILAIGTLTGLLAQKIKVPDVAIFLIAGMVIGPEMLGLINIKPNSALNQIILLFGARTPGREPQMTRARGFWSAERCFRIRPSPT